MQLLVLALLSFQRIEENECITHDPEVINNIEILVAELLHHTFYLFLANDLDFVLFIELVHSLRENLEDGKVSFAFGVKKLDIEHRRLFKPLNKLSRLLVVFFIWIGDIDPGLQASLFHWNSDAVEKRLLAIG